MALRINASSEHAHRAMPWAGGSFTIVFWVHRLGGATSARFLAGMLDTDDATPETSADPRVTINTAAGNAVVGNFLGAGSNTADTSTATLSSSAWSHVAVTFIGAGSTLTDVEVSINGTATGSPGTGSRVMSTNGVMDRLQIGSNTANFSNADFAHFAFYDVKLSGSQITELQTKLPNAITGATPTVYESLIGSEGGFTLANSATIDSTNDGTLPSLSGGDTTAPVLTSAVGTATGPVTAIVGATTDEANGTLWAVVTTSATQPSIAQIKAGQDHTGAAAAYSSSQTITTTGAKTFGATGLIASTGYYAHLLHTDAAANDSNRLSSGLFTTSAADVTAPTLTSPTGAGGSLVCSGSVSTNEANGTLYAVATSSSTAPSAAQVKLGQDHTGTAAMRAVSQSVSASGTQTIGAGVATAGTFYWHFMHEDASLNQSAVSSSASFVVTSAGTNNIRLQPSLDLERGAYAASRTIARWWVLTSDLLSVLHTGATVATNASGQLTIDINGTSYAVGDNVPLWVAEFNPALAPLDRTVRSGLIWVPAIAQA